jgi:PAS domain S-box-containing protein
MRLTAMRDRALAATHALQEKEQLAEKYLDIASALIISLDTNGNVKLVNKYGQELYFDKSMIGAPLFSRVPDYDLVSARNCINDLLKGCGPDTYKCEFSLVDRYGKEHLIQWNIMPYETPDGTVTGLLCSGQDITEQAIAQSMLVEERNKFLSVLEALEIGVYIIDSAHNIEYVNPAMRSFFGDPGSMKCYEYLHRLDGPCPECPNDRVFEGHVLKRENTYPHIGRKFSLTELPIFNENGTMSKLELFYPDTFPRSE